MGLRIPTPGEALACSHAAGLNSEAPNLWDRLAGLWPPQGAAGGRWLDLSGYRRNGTFANSPVWTTGPLGRAIDFAGATDQRVEYSGGIAAIGTAPYTVLARIYQPVAAIAGIVTINSFDPAWAVNATGNLYIYDGGSLTASSGAISSTAWNTVAWVRYSTAASGTTYYINGRAAGTVTHSLSLPAVTTLTFGSDRNAASTYEFDGQMDFVGLWPGRALSAAEVAQVSYDPMAMVRRRPFQIAVKAPAPPAGTNVPAAYMYYKRLRAG